MDNKYKVGDEVLLRVKIEHYSGPSERQKIGVTPYSVTQRFHNSSSAWFDEKLIYSLAPEFNIGEEAEFSDDGLRWVKDKFSHVDIRGNKIEYKYKAENSCYKLARKISKETTCDGKTVEIDGKTYILKLKD